MKKTLLSFAFVVVLAVSVIFTASAASFTSLADDLQAIGVFKGTDSGYELDREPTRIEAAVMLVRLLGEEENAATSYSSGLITHPFTDVPDWADAYVAYLYANGLTNGVSSFEFGAVGICSAQMYCTYLLRVLGYSDKDGGDFTYDGVLDFAIQKGLIDSTLLLMPFTRDCLVAVSYQALATDVKDGGNLLAKLVANGAVDADAAQNISEKIAFYDKISAAYNIETDSIDADFTMDMSMTMDGQTITTIFISHSIKTNITASSVEAELSLTVTNPESGEQMTITEWIKDGWIYIDDGTTKIKLNMTYDETLATIRDISITADFMPIYYIADIAETSSNGGKVYTVTILQEFLNAATEGIFDEVLSDGQVLKIDSVTESYTFDQTGTLTQTGTAMVMIMSDPDNGDVTATLNYSMTINSSGETVVINFPDFTGFTDIAA